MFDLHAIEFLASGYLTGRLELQRLEMCDSKFCWEPGQVLIINPSSELILVSLTERTDVEWKNTEKENGKNFVFKTRWILDSPQARNIYKNRTLPQIITDHLATHLLGALSGQKHTSTTSTPSRLTCFSSCLHSSLQFWLSPQKGLSANLEPKPPSPVKNGACDSVILWFFSFPDPKFHQKRSRELSIHQLERASDPFGDHRVSSLWHHQPHQNESIPNTKHQTPNTTKHQETVWETFAFLRFLSKVFLFVFVGQSSSCGEILRSRPGFPRFSRPTRACRMVAWNKWWTLQMGHVFWTCLFATSTSCNAKLCEGI